MRSLPSSGSRTTSVHVLIPVAMCPHREGVAVFIGFPWLTLHRFREMEDRVASRKYLRDAWDVASPGGWQLSLVCTRSFALHRSNRESLRRTLRITRSPGQFPPVFEHRD